MEKLKEKNSDRHEVYASTANKQTNKRTDNTLARGGHLSYPKAPSPYVVTDLSAARHGAL